MVVYVGTGYYFENVYSLMVLYRHVNSVLVLPEAPYYYCTNPASLSRKHVPGRYQKIKHFYTECLNLCSALGYDQNIRHRVSKPYLANTLGSLKQEMAAPLPLRERMRNIRAIIDDETLQQVLAENKNDKVSVTRRIIFFAMRGKLYGLCCLLLKMRK